MVLESLLILPIRCGVGLCVAVIWFWATDPETSLETAGLSEELRRKALGSPSQSALPRKLMTIQSMPFLEPLLPVGQLEAPS